MMTMGDNKIMIDTNILVYANMFNSPLHNKSRIQLQEQNNKFDQLCISVQIVREYIAVKSKITFLDGCYNACEIVLDIKEFEQNYFISINNLAFQKEFLRLLYKYEVKGKQVHDCNIAATMLVNNINNVFTNNIGDFKRYEPEGIKVISLI